LAPKGERKVNYGKPPYETRAVATRSSLVKKRRAATHALRGLFASAETERGTGRRLRRGPLQKRGWPSPRRIVARAARPTRRTNGRRCRSRRCTSRPQRSGPEATC